ncbi:MAG TPA: SDR family oxidoreductase [Anaerolineae bacterium]
MRNYLKKTAILAATAIVGLIGFRALRRPEADLRGQIALITGGTRGLGFLLAREFAREGCRVVICARDEAELVRAKADLVQEGAEVLALVCDVADKEDVRRMVDDTLDHYGRIDILVNNAGVIQVGPVETMKTEDFEEAFGVMVWGLLYPTLATLPHMLERRHGRIVNITSIGGKVAVPHLSPYTGAKFAAVGLSEGLRAELAGTGVSVTTIVPGLMRTGSYLNAFFKGRQAGEFTWFSLGASLPFISMDAERASRQIVQATRRGEAERTLSLPAVLLARFHDLFPGLTTDLLGLVNRILLPNPDGAGPSAIRGTEVQSRLGSPHRQILDFLTTLGRRAAHRFHQFPGPVTIPPEERQTTVEEDTETRELDRL